MPLPPSLGRIPRPARTISDLAATFHHFDAQRYAWLAHYLREAGRPHIADAADRWAEEHEAMAAHLTKGRD